MKNLFSILLLVCLFYACVPEDHVLEIEIVNNTSEPVQDLSINTAGDMVGFKADNLPAGQKIDHTLQVPRNFADGDYTFSFSRSNGQKGSATGSYLDNQGEPLKETLVFNIQEQEVIVERKVLKTE